MQILSPITESKNVIPEGTIDSKEIINEYKKIKPYGVNVDRFFSNLKKISIYKCLDTGYKFYYPFETSGDNLFYQEIEQNPWYYTDWKWEHQISYNFINSCDKVLEIGCAKGSFIKRLKNKGAVVTGLEMNSEAVKYCNNINLDVTSDSIESFSKKNTNSFDVVCSYQVLEHVTNVKKFIESSLAVLKPGGQMIISVPNNESFMINDFFSVTNMPPHHMGLWNINTMISLQKYFGMELEKLYIEPLQMCHAGFAKLKAEKYLDKKLNEKFKIFPEIFRPALLRFVNIGVYATASDMIGHSILCIYKKNA